MVKLEMDLTSSMLQVCDTMKGKEERRGPIGNKGQVDGLLFFEIFVACSFYSVAYFYLDMENYSFGYM